MAHRNLAASVVVTVSLAEFALVGCKVGQGPPIHENPPGPNVDEGQDGAEPVPEQTPPEVTPTDSPPDGEFQSTTTIERQPDGTCLETTSVQCPPKVMCNPPPPRTVPCLEDEPSGI